MVKTTLYSTAQVLPGNKVEVQAPNLSVGQTVEVIIIVQEADLPSSDIPRAKESISLEQRLALLKLPIAERRHILSAQAQSMLDHYQESSDWQEWVAGDIIAY